jgi:hypothetical protein
MEPLCFVGELPDLEEVAHGRDHGRPVQETVWVEEAGDDSLYCCMSE